MKNTQERNDLISFISDMEKEAYGIRLRRDLSSYTLGQLEGEVKYLTHYREALATADREEQEYQESCGVSLFDQIFGE